MTRRGGLQYFAKSIASDRFRSIHGRHVDVRSWPRLCENADVSRTSRNLRSSSRTRERFCVNSRFPFDQNHTIARRSPSFHTVSAVSDRFRSSGKSCADFRLFRWDISIPREGIVDATPRAPAKSQIVGRVQPRDFDRYCEEMHAMFGADVTRISTVDLHPGYSAAKMITVFPHVEAERGLWEAARRPAM